MTASEARNIKKEVTEINAEKADQLMRDRQLLRVLQLIHQKASSGLDMMWIDEILPVWVKDELIYRGFSVSEDDGYTSTMISW